MSTVPSATPASAVSSFISDGCAERVPLSRTLIEVLDVSKDATRRLTVVRQNFLVSRRSVESGADSNVEIYRNLTLPREFICR